MKDPEDEYDDIEDTEYDSISINKPTEYNDDDYDYWYGINQHTSCKEIRFRIYHQEYSRI